MRRRRPTREKIAFNFDSFLDVVTNVVGIILRLILVAWVGARAYKGPTIAAPPPPALEEIVELPDPRDPLAAELECQRQELANAQARLLEQIREWERVRQRRELTATELAMLREQQQRLAAEQNALSRIAAVRGQGAQSLALSLADLQTRSRKLHEDIESLRRSPPLKQTLRYRTPVSRPLQSEELLFECREGRIAFIDIGGMLDEVRTGLREKADLLRTQWEVSDVTQPAGPFRLRYQIEREKELLEGATPGGSANFRYGLSGWEVEPIARERGERLDDALATGSAFRKVIEAIDPQQTAVTMCVYPDSFVLYRKLRNWLHERDVVVAGRPLPPETPIASSRRGTVSRGQ